MDNEQFTKWLLVVSTEVNRTLKLMPPMAWERGINMLLTQYGGDKLLQVASTLGIVDTEKIKLMAEQYPGLGTQLPHEDARQAVRNWVSTSKFASRLKTLRLIAAWLPSSDEKPSDSQLEWQIDDTPNNGKIYHTLLRGGQNEEGICNN